MNLVFSVGPPSVKWGQFHQYICDCNPMTAFMLHTYN